MKGFLINVTSFFRDEEAGEALKSEIGSSFKDRPSGSLVRAWIPGCSTGEGSLLRRHALDRNAPKS